MSGYNYYENRDKSCANTGDYYRLAQTTTYTCDQPCICRESQERTAKDRMYYDVFMSDKPVSVQQMVQMANKSGVPSCKN